MSAIEPKPLHTEDHALFELLADRGGESAEWQGIWAHVLWLEQREAHVTAVLRQAERCGGGYGFAAALLRYLGADQEEQG